MEKIDLDELVDAYVDGELSREERCEFESLVESDSCLRSKIDGALWLRERLGSLKTSLPEGFARRLRSSLDESEAWKQFDKGSGANRSRTRGWLGVGNVNSGWFFPAVAAACVLVVVVGASVAGIAYLRHDNRVQDVGVYANNANANRWSERFEVEEAALSRQHIMTPSPEGNLPNSVAAPLSQKQLWVRASFATKQDCKRMTHEFERLCGRLDLRFSKFSGDAEFRLQGVSPSHWRHLAEWFEIAPCESVTSSGLETWLASEDANEKSKTLRVTFMTTDAAESTTDVTTVGNEEQ